MKLVVANLKMNMDYNTTLEYINNVNKNIIVCPTYIYIPYFLNKVSVGAQDCYIFDSGAYTGYVSPKQLKNVGVEYVIIGHSERRLIEDNELIYKKVVQAINNNLKVILCVGENLNEDKEKKLYDQLKDYKDMDLIIAYEPIWSIGTGVIPSSEQIDESMKFIKSIVKMSKTLYGGSVSIDNIELLNKIDSVDGYLVGGASLDYNKINKIYDLSN